MLKKVFLFIVSLIITFLLINSIGYPIEQFETQLYRKITGKQKQHIEFDTAGVPYVVYEGNLGKQYNIVTVAEYVLDLSKHPDASKNQFINCINWLISKGEFLNDSSIIFLNQYNWPGYKMSPPWRSAMNQGRAMQAFIKAYEQTGDSSYLEYSRKSMNTLYTSVSEGGVTYIDSTGYWFEEYADDNVPQSRVLNGMIVVLQALSDFHKVTNNSNALFLFGKGVAAVKKSIRFYDNNGHSNYDILGKPANPWYHKFHIELLDYLDNATNEPIFKDYSLVWSKYKEPSYLKALIQKPTRVRLFSVFSLFTITILLVFFANYFFLKLKGKIH